MSSLPYLSFGGLLLVGCASVAPGASGTDGGTGNAPRGDGGLGVQDAGLNLPDASLGVADAGTRDAAVPDAATRARDSGLLIYDAATSDGAVDAAPPPVDAARSDSASDAGTPDSASWMLDGGTADTLVFGIVGDTRPYEGNWTNPTDDPSTGYPLGIIQKAFRYIQSSPTSPMFVVGAGDYQMADNSVASDTQLGLYQSARNLFRGPFYPTMGNHECDNATNSNCAGGFATPMFTNFVSRFLTAPFGLHLPYYSVNVSSSVPGAWTAKFVFVAANAWDAEESDWLTRTLERPTTYTFVVRHEPTVGTGTENGDISVGGPPSDAIILGHPFTLLIAGHAHHHSVNEVTPAVAANPPPQPQIIIGNGGAPLDLPSHPGYGYGIVQQLPSGELEVNAWTFDTAADADVPTPDPTFCFIEKPSGGAVGGCP